MATKHHIIRIMYLVEKFSEKEAAYDYEEVSDFLEQKMADYDEEFYYSDKTFQRDRKLIEETLKITISYDPSIKKYRVEEDSDDLINIIGDRMLLMEAYKQNFQNREYMIWDTRRAKGLEHIHGLLHAIQNQSIITCSYTKFWDTAATKKALKPYALKEFQERWYLLAKDDSNQLKTYGLDRISDLEISSSSFRKESIDLQAAFTHSFGIMSTLGQKPETIQLSFDAAQGKYFLSKPLHPSQQVLKNDDQELVLQLELVPTYDFYQELLKQASRVKVLAPASVKKEYVRWLKRALEMNG